MDQVLTNGFDGIVDDLSPCNHEEADTRLFLHEREKQVHDGVGKHTLVSRKLYRDSPIAQKPSVKSRDIDVIPPIKDALHQHSLRAAYQAGYVWGQSCKKVQALPDPTLWGWKKIDGNSQRGMGNEFSNCWLKSLLQIVCGTCVKSALISLLDSNVGTYGHLVADVVEAMQETAMPLIEPSGTVEVIAQMLDIHPAEMQDVDVEDALERLTTRLEEGENRR
eukprot:gene4061-4613_t